MPRFVRSIVVAFVLCLASFALVPVQAIASHYDLADIELVPLEVRQKLHASGIDTTEHLLTRLTTAEDRKSFVSLSGLPAGEVDSLARVLELLQITGIGPKAARLLIASGVKSASELAATNPDELLEKLLITNSELTITGVDPDLIVVEDWITKAGSVPIHLE